MLQQPQSGLGSLTAGRMLARNATWSLLGQVSYLLVGVAAIPILVRQLGTDRFGVLAIAWILIGYFSLFDVGLGRALTKLVSQALATGDVNQLRMLAWTGSATMLVLGCVGAGLLAELAPLLATRVLKVPPALHGETLDSLYLLAIGVPVTIVSTGLRGILEAGQRFGLVTLSRTLLGLFTYVGPIAVLPFSDQLPAVVAVLVIGRFAYCVVVVLMCSSAFPLLRTPKLSPAVLKPLITFGGWVTVSNIVSPLMVSMDRLLISALVSVAAAAYYVAPYEAVTRLLVIPNALMAVVFPAFAASYASDPARVRVLFTRTLRYSSLALFPATMLLVVFAQEGLHAWLGDTFARQSTRVLQILAVGVLINGLAQVPFGHMQASGRPDLTAKLHLAELVPYAIAVYWATITFGIVGTAAVWLLRVSVDAVALFGLSIRRLSLSSSQIVHMCAVFAATVASLGLAVAPQSALEKVLYVGLALALAGWFGWHSLAPSEKSYFDPSRFVRRFIRSN